MYFCELVTFVGSTCLRRLARSSAAPSRGEGVRTSGGVSTRSGSGRLRRTAQGELVWRRSPLTRRSRSSLLSSRAASLIFLRDFEILRHPDGIMTMLFRARIFKLLRSPRIDYKESVAQGGVTWRAGTSALFLLGS
jgi:hypothetical protein